MGAIKGALKLFSGINKAQGVSENQNPQEIDKYESSYSETEVIELIAQWKRDYNVYDGDVKPSQELAFKYWIGDHRRPQGGLMNDDTPLVDNKIFESIETFIPIATRANPDPMVTADPNDFGQQLAHSVKQALVFEADRQKLRKLLKKQLRHWILYRIGILKVTWNELLGEIETEVINPMRMVFDKNGHWDESGVFTGQYIGEKKKTTAERLSKLFPKKSEVIKEKVNRKMGTEIEYFEWWYQGRDIFYTMDEFVLGKFKNPNWNYDTEATDEELDENGQMTKPPVPAVKAKNLFKQPRTPYIGLSVFTTGLQPHDETSLVLQNIGIQDMINRRWSQIDFNVDSMNNGLAVGNAFTEAQASQAAQAIRKGIAIRVPSGKVEDQIARLPAAPIPDEVFETLRDGRDELRNVFGTSGSTPEGVNSQDTVRGKILVNQLDSSRIGGGVTEFIEQVADTWYNTLVQMMFVHFTDEQFIVASGSDAGTELITIKNTDLGLLQTLSITVKEGSLIPKDPLTQRNEAIDLWSANAIDPISFYQKLDYPDPEDSAKKLLLWQMVQQGKLSPEAYIPDFQVPVQSVMPQQGVGGNAVNPLGPATPPEPSPPATQGAIGAESKQLIQSVPAR